MADAGRRQPAVNEPFHSLPTDASSLASMFEHVMPELAHGKAKVSESIPIARYSVVADMPAHDCCQPLADHRNGFMHASPQFGFHRLQLGLHALADRLPEHGEPSLTRFPADVRESEKMEGFRLSQTSTLPAFDRVAGGWPTLRNSCTPLFRPRMRGSHPSSFRPEATIDRVPHPFVVPKGAPENAAHRRV